MGSPLRVLAHVAALAAARPFLDPTPHPTMLANFGTAPPTTLDLPDWLDAPGEPLKPTYAPSIAPTQKIAPPPAPTTTKSTTHFPLDECNDEPPKNVRSAGGCAAYVRDHPSRSCSASSLWVVHRYCQQTCADAGRAYAGSPCAARPPPSPPPTAAAATRSPTRAPATRPTRRPTLPAAVPARFQPPDLSLMNPAGRRHDDDDGGDGAAWVVGARGVLAAVGVAFVVAAACVGGVARWATAAPSKAPTGGAKYHPAGGDDEGMEML